MIFTIGVLGFLLAALMVTVSCALSMLAHRKMPVHTQVFTTSTQKQEDITLAGYPRAIVPDFQGVDSPLDSRL